MSIGQGVESAFNTFIAMQRNRNARADAERDFRYKQQYDARRLSQIDRELSQRDGRLDIDRDVANTGKMNAQTNRMVAETAAERLSLDEQIQQLNEEEKRRGWENKDSLGLVGRGIDNGYIDPVTNQLKPEFFDALKNGDSAAQRFAGDVQVFTKPERYPDGFRPSQFDFISAPGSVRVVGIGPQGPGVITENATSDPEDPVANLSVEQFESGLARDIDDLVLAAYGPQYLTLAATKGTANEALSREEENRAEAEAQEIVRQTAVKEMYRVGGLKAGRELEAILASASPQERTQVIRDLADTFNLELPQLSSASGAGDISEVPELAQGDVYERYGRSTQYQVGKYDRELERLSKILDDPDLSSSFRNKFEEDYAQVSERRDSFIEKANNKVFKEISSDLDDAKKALERARPGRQKYWQQRVVELQSDYDALVKTGVDTPVKKSSGWKKLEEDVLAKVKGLSPDEVDDLVDKGLLQFTPETSAALRQRASELEVKSVPDLKKLPTEEELAYRAILSVFAEDATTRASVRQTLDNLTETGSPSTSGLQQNTAATNRLSAEAALLRARDNLEKTLRSSTNTGDQAVADATTYAQEFLTNVYKERKGEDGRGAVEAVGKYFPQMILEFGKYRRNQQALRPLFEATNAAMSTIFADLSNQDLGTSFGDQLVSFFTPSASGDPTDFDLRNISISPDGTRLTYIGPGSREQGARVSRGALENVIGPRATDLLVAAAKANRAATSARLGE